MAWRSPACAAAIKAASESGIGGSIPRESFSGARLSRAMTIEVPEEDVRADHREGNRAARFLGQLVRTLPRVRADLRGRVRQASQHRVGRSTPRPNPRSRQRSRSRDPTLMAFRDGLLVFAKAGALSPAALEKLVAQVRALDMDDVRRRVAEQTRVAG